MQLNILESGILCFFSKKLGQLGNKKYMYEKNILGWPKGLFVNYS